MRKLATLATAALILTGSVGTADAQWRGRGWGYHGGYYRHSGGAVAAGLIGGALLGGLVASAAAAPAYGYGYGYPAYGYGYGYPAYAYYSPPVYYRPRYYYARPVYYAPRYYGWNRGYYGPRYYPRAVYRGYW